MMRLILEQSADSVETCLFDGPLLFLVSQIWDINKEKATPSNGSNREGLSLHWTLSMH